jgi:LCP family protein required for cell wall assembly
MTHELDVLRATRAEVDHPSAAARTAARARWDTDTLAVVAAAPVRSRSAGARTFTARALIATALAAALTAGVWIVTRERITSVKPKHTIAVSSLADTPAHDPQVFLLVGSDTRSFEAADGRSYGGGQAPAAGDRSDLIMLVRLDPDSHRVTTVSIPRDLFVDVPGCGTEKINSAFDSALVCGDRHGGTQLLVDTITGDLGVPVNHVIEVRFDQFTALADELGGLRINFPLPTRDRYTGLDQPVGCATLSGEQALAFVRSRHYEVNVAGQWQEDPTADLGRMSRQQLALRQLAAAADARAGTDPRPLLRALFDHIVVDSGFTSDDALRYFEALHREHQDRVITLPTVVSTLHGAPSGLALAPDAQSVLDVLAGRGESTSLQPPASTPTEPTVPAPSAC